MNVKSYSEADLLVTTLSLASLVLGLVVAIEIIPEASTSEYLLRWPALAMTVGVLGCIAADLFVRGIKRGFAAQHYIFVGLIYFNLLDLMQSLYTVDDLGWAVKESFVAISLFAAGCVVGSAIQPRPLPKVLKNLSSHAYTTRLLFKALVIFFILGMFDFAYYSGFSISTMFGGLLESRWGAPWARGDLGGWNAFFDFMTYFGYALPTFTVMLALRRRTWNHWTVVVGLLFSLIFLLFVAQGGGRRLPGVIVGAALFTWLGFYRDRLRLKHTLIAVAIVAGLLFAMEIMLDTRNRGFRDFTYESDEIRQVRVDDNFLRLAQIIQIVPKDNPHLGFEWLWFILIRPVPRVFWPGKPIGLSFSLPAFLGYKGVSYSLSVVGEWYLAFGWWGVAGSGFLFGILARWWTQLFDQSETPTGIAIYGMGLMAIFLGIRSMIEVILTTYPLLCLIAVDRLFLRPSFVPKPAPRYEALPYH